MGSREQTLSGTSGETRDVDAPASEPENAFAAGPAPIERARTEIAPAAELVNHGVQSGAVSTWRPPAVVGKYSIERIVGCGGMGQVYRAWDGDLQRSVAVKFILGIEPDATVRQRFMVEARATARIQHPNVLTIYDVKECDGRPYLVMEFLSGRTLDKITKPLHWSRALEIGLLLSSGLAAAHRSGVLHRDIKPDNVMLTHDGQVKLLDFGLAKVATRLSTPSMVLKPDPVHAPAAPTLRARDQMAMAEPALEAVTAAAPLVTDTGAVVGTPGYMAPESWLGRATTQSDVYSLGALLFELCAGRAPYADVTTTLSIAVQTRDAPLLTTLVPTVSPGFAAVIARCLSRDPGARYASGVELCEALKELERPVLSGPIAASDPFRAGAGARSAARPEEPRATARRRTHAPEARSSMAFREVGTLVVSVLSAATPKDEDWSAYVQFCRKKMAQERIGVLAVTAGGGPSAKQRMVLREILPTGAVPAAVVTDAPIVRNMVTALGWFNRGIRSFPLDKGAGLLEALKYLRVSGPMAARTLMEIEAMRAEVGTT